MIRIIVAMDDNRGISKDGQIPWHNADDMFFFKSQTVNHTIVMGRKTYESIGRPLRDRENLVLTRNSNFCPNSNNVQIIHSIDEIKTQSYFVIGGSEIYLQFLQKGVVDECIVTHIKGGYECDTFFPDLSQFGFMACGQFMLGENANVIVFRPR